VVTVYDKSAHPGQRPAFGASYAQEVLYEIATKRFSAVNHREQEPLTSGGPSWLWDPDPNKSQLHVVMQYAEGDSHTNATPLITITTGTQSLVDIGIIGDNATHLHQVLSSGAKILRHYIGLEAGMTVVGQTRAESETLAQMLFEVFLSCRHQICTAFGFHDVSAPTLSATYPSGAYPGHYETRMALRIVWERSVDIQPYIQWDVRLVRSRVKARLTVPTNPAGDYQDTEY
jgi:hypothetical protein